MSLSRTLLNGGTYGSTVDTSKYSYSDGAFRIARESIEELHEIFIESFYNVEQAELAAACEGVALEGSQYEAVAEAAIGNAIDKVKMFFKKLWDKVKGFFANVRKFIDSLFKSGKEFANKYANEIKNLPSFKDYKVKMYKYNDTLIESGEMIMQDNAEIASKVLDIEAVEKGAINMSKRLDTFESDPEKSKTNASKAGTTGINKKVMDVKFIDDDDLDKKILAVISPKFSGDPDDFDKWIFAQFRNGAEDSTDMDEEEFTNSDIKNMAKTLQDTKASTVISKAQSKSDKGFKDAIKRVDKYADEMEKVKTADGSKSSEYAQQLAKIARHFSSAFSTAQNFQNTMINAWRTAYGERDAAYKKAIYGAFSYAKKYKKN